MYYRERHRKLGHTCFSVKNEPYSIQILSYQINYVRVAAILFSKMAALYHISGSAYRRQGMLQIC